MSEKKWREVDRYIVEELVGHDPVLEAALAASEAAGLPPIHVAPNQGKLLMLLAQASRASRILEIGTLGGYSTIWLGRALPPHGRLVSLEANPAYAKVAQANLDRAGLADIVELKVGAALGTLPQLAAAGVAPFDLVFIDADKPSTPDYFDWALKLTRRGSLIVVDNVVRGGHLADPRSRAPEVRAMRRFFEIAAAAPRVSMTAIQTVGSKGHDGIAIALVTADP
jgi:predicted O-methyltransferase YrrM